MKRASKITGQSKALLIGIWITLLALGNESPERGRLLISLDLPITIDELEEETGLPAETILSAIDAFKELGMLNGKSTIEITNWGKRQFQSDYSTARVRKHRAKRSNETFQKRYETVIDTETDTDTETDNATAIVFRHFQNEIQLLTPVIAQTIDEWIKEFPQDWIIQAIDEAVKNNVKKVRYIQKILDNWKAEGKGNKSSKKESEKFAYTIE